MLDLDFLKILRIFLEIFQDSLKEENPAFMAFACVL